MKQCMNMESFEFYTDLMGWTIDWVGSAVIHAGGFIYTYYDGVVCLVGGLS